MSQLESPPEAVTSRAPTSSTLGRPSTGRQAEADGDLFSLGNLMRFNEEQALRRRSDARNLRRLPWLLWAFALVSSIEVVFSLEESSWWGLAVAGAHLLICVTLALTLRRAEGGAVAAVAQLRAVAHRPLAERASVVAGAALLLQLALVTAWVRLVYGAESDSAWFAFVPWLVLAFRFRPPQALAVHGGMVAVSVLEVLGFGGDPELLIAAAILNAVALAAGSLATHRFRKDFLDQWRSAVGRGREQMRMREELETARAVQLSMLPRRAPAFPGLDVATAMVPATEVGGDYYDFFPRRDGGLAIVIGDVAGHGLGAGLVLSGVRSGLHLLMESEEDLRVLLERLDRMVRQTSHRRMRVSMLLAEIGPGRELRIASAGHPPLLIRDGESGEVAEVDLPALPLGSTLGDPAHAAVRLLAPGDVLLLYTDGLFEAADPDGEPFGFPRVHEVLAAHDPEAGSEALRERLLAALRDFRRGAPPEDDVTLVAVTVLALPGDDGRIDPSGEPPISPA